MCECGYFNTSMDHALGHKLSLTLYTFMAHADIECLA